MMTNEPISAALADWSREIPHGFWDPGRKLLKAVRDYQRTEKRRGVFAAVNKAFAVLRHRFWQLVTQSEIPLNADIGGGLLLPHPQGIVIHPSVRIGVNCLLFHQTTLGVSGGKSGLPILGGHVDVGAGAKILGPVTIGDHARIGANAVVLCDVPAGATAVGVPARIIVKPAASASPQT